MTGDHRKPGKSWRMRVSATQEILGLIAGVIWFTAAGMHSYGAEYLLGIPLEKTATYALIGVGVHFSLEFVRTSSLVAICTVAMTSKLVFDYFLS